MNSTQVAQRPVLLMEKVRPIREVANELGKATTAGAKIVQCHGVFDLLHIGHIRHLIEARQLGDLLVVTITPDRFVNKGPHRPAFSEELRAEALAALACVDFVCISEWPTAVETIHMLRPAVFVKGAVGAAGPRDRNDAIDLESEAIQNVGGRLVLTDTELASASALINRHTEIFSHELKDFLRQFRAQYSAEQLVTELAQLESMRVLVLGESFVESTGRPADGGLADANRSSERYAGGAIAVANSLSRFSDHVALLTTGIGDEATPGFLQKNAAPGIELEIVEAAEPSSSGFVQLLDRLLDRYDVVLLSDHGSNFVSQTARDLIRSRASFFALDLRQPDLQSGLAASESGADLVVQSESSTRTSMSAASDPFAGGATRALAEQWAAQHKCRFLLLICDLAVDSRRSAALVYDSESGAFTEVPEFPVNEVNRSDRMGTEEALFALCAMCCARGLSPAAVGFVGNLAVAAAMTMAGTGHALDPRLIYRHVDSLLK